MSHHITVVIKQLTASTPLPPAAGPMLEGVLPPCISIHSAEMVIFVLAETDWKPVCVVVIAWDSTKGVIVGAAHGGSNNGA